MVEDALNVNIGIRPCIVTHKVKGESVQKNAIFHRWATTIVGSGNKTVAQLLALVEYEDGSVAQVKVKNLRFIDGMVEQYFKEFQNDEKEDITEPVQM